MVKPYGLFKMDQPSFYFKQRLHAFKYKSKQIHNKNY